MRNLENKQQEKDFSVTTDIEIKTVSGQLVRVTCRYDEREMVKQWLRDNIKEVEIPGTQEISEVGHGGYGFFSRYDIKQHRYVGGGFPGCGGYIEVLHVQNPPEKRHGVIIHVNKNGISTFYEIEDLLKAFDLFNENMGKLFDGIVPENSGVIRKVVCGWFQPWFCAIGNQSLCGDYVFPDNIGINDPIFAYLRKFIVKNYNGTKEVKTCIAFTKMQGKSDYSDQKTTQFTAWWTDGTCTFWEGSNSYHKLELLTAKDLWIQETMNEFKKMLAGEISGLCVSLNNGNKITAKVEPDRKKTNRVIKTENKTTPKSIEVKIINEDEWTGVFTSTLDEN